LRLCRLSKLQPSLRDVARFHFWTVD
jgi:hypothetical protein